MKGCRYFRLPLEEIIPVPPESRLFRLPERMPLGARAGTERIVSASKHPGTEGRSGFYPVACFAPPGYTVTYSPAYREIGNPPVLPLFSYGACAFYKGAFHVAAVRVDRDRRHDPRFIDMNRVRRKVRELTKAFPDNRLVSQLAVCALSYGCPGGQNFFLGRYECPLPTAPSCNAGCRGCISLPSDGIGASAQPRIGFVPSPEEVSEVALFHLGRVRDPVLSFGQGCEGEPLLASEVLEKAIALIRRKTSRGVIHVNTNGSRPEVLRRLFAAGLDSVRISINSARETFYTRYYRPRDYAFRDVLEALNIARTMGGYTSLNYLTMPGFTDSMDELEALMMILEGGSVDMIQWRNLNFDPMRYFTILRVPGKDSKLLGIREAIQSVRERFPGLKIGYFNPSRRQMKKSG
jgi:pyruvate-formate lyase-activating enzyme